jgi:molybdopterin-guanine dinucleotide biosynthesis protein A
MGRDKAGVLVDGEPLWRRQLATLRAVAPQEIFISGKLSGPYAGTGLEVLQDLHADIGPLAGFEAAAARMRTPFLLVLAIDLPWMRADFLADLVALAIVNGRGVVPQGVAAFEPLAAVYSRAALDTIAECLSGADHSLQHFVRRAVQCDLLLPFVLAAEHRPLFRNVNTPADLG